MKKEKKNSWGIFISLFIVFSMVFSIFAVIMNNPEQSLKYGKYKFTITQTGYITKINGESMTFQYYPSELERINITPEIKSKIMDSEALIVLFNPNMTDEELQYIDYVRYDLQIRSGKAMGFGLVSPNEKYSLNVLSCENSTSEVPFIIMNDSSNTEFVMDGNCIYMNARLRENIAAGERLIYMFNGVMS